MNSFSLIQQTHIQELDTEAKIYIHEDTGAEILFLSNQDENKCFGIAFRTPPQDSTGVAHILEHTVLCGSEKYPVKDPFVQLLKGSLQTFLNAFTYPDKTCYPVASQNLQDFHNLVGVYLDAVFKPRITRDFFMQEGWHYHLEEIDQPLEYKGVVYNEMKGVYSSSESVLMETSQQSLFPNTTYGLDSGGKPEIIPQLTYEAFKEFHSNFYHPSNACIVFYGDDPEEDRFRLLAEYLDSYSKIKPNSAVDLQKPFSEPTRISRPYAVSESEPNPTPMFTINWVLPTPTTAETVFSFTLLDHILLGTPASPLRKALIESGLGEDLTGGGLETHLKQMCFCVGLKGVEKKQLEKAEALIFDTLQTLATNGISEQDIHAALNSFEFELRENNSGGFPRGLALWLKSLNGWVYGADPLELIAFEKPLQQLKQQAQQPGFFEAMLQTYFIKNTHRSTVTLHPDPGLAAEIETAEKKRLATIKERMSLTELKKIQQQTVSLMQLQETPDSTEAIASLPLLNRKDLEPQIKPIDCQEQPHQEATILQHPLFTNGILYMDLGLNLNTLEEDEIPYVSLLGNLYLEMGTKNKTYTDLSQRIAITTGGIYGTPFISPHEEDSHSVHHFFFRGKCMLPRVDDLLHLFKEIFLYPTFDDPDRFKQIVLEHKSDIESSIIPRGHSAVITRLKATDHAAYTLNEKIGGIDALFFARDLLERIDTDWLTIRQKIQTIHQKIISQNGILVNLTAESSALKKVTPQVEQFVSTLPICSNHPIQLSKQTYPVSEALIVPSRINFVGAAANLYEQNYQMHGSALVISRYLQTAWLWEKIRVQGGAYGGMCAFDQRVGTFTFASYRDPNLEDSIKIYQQTGQFLKDLKLDEAELTRSLIGAIGQLDAYMLPDSKSFTNAKRRLVGYTDTKRQQLRDEVLSTTQQHFNQFGEILDAAFRNPRVAVLCDQESAARAGLKTQTIVL
ncbi:MAG: peptidase M16 [Kiritimatiellaceae bacterium]|nr:peptidase M16 [Kiritimatiellaceae bacterium]